MITEIAKCHENPEKSGGKVHWRWPLGKGRNRSDMDSHLVRSVSKSGWISTKCLKSGWISTKCLRMDEFPFHYVSRGMEFPHADTCGLSSQGCHYMRIEFPKVSEFRMKLRVKLRTKLTKIHEVHGSMYENSIHLLSSVWYAWIDIYNCDLRHLCHENISPLATTHVTPAKQGRIWRKTMWQCVNKNETGDRELERSEKTMKTDKKRVKTHAGNLTKFMHQCT